VNDVASCERDTLLRPHTPGAFLGMVQCWELNSKLRMRVTCEWSMWSDRLWLRAMTRQDSSRMQA
jgi:hypothetical protein